MLIHLVAWVVIIAESRLPSFSKFYRWNKKRRTARFYCTKQAVLPCVPLLFAVERSIYNNQRQENMPELQCSQANATNSLATASFSRSYMYTVIIFLLSDKTDQDSHFFGSSFFSSSVFASALFSPSCALCCPEILCHMFLRKPSSW